MRRFDVLHEAAAEKTFRFMRVGFPFLGNRCVIGFKGRPKAHCFVLRVPLLRDTPMCFPCDVLFAQGVGKMCWSKHAVLDAIDFLIETLRTELPKDSTRESGLLKRLASTGSRIFKCLDVRTLAFCQLMGFPYDTTKS